MRAPLFLILPLLSFGLFVTPIILLLNGNIKGGDVWGFFVPSILIALCGVVCASYIGDKRRRFTARLIYSFPLLGAILIGAFFFVLAAVGFGW